jgi:hypothetical protein
LERQEVGLREALLRLSGAIDVLEEIVTPAPMMPGDERADDLLSPLTRLPG